MPEKKVIYAEQSHARLKFGIPVRQSHALITPKGVWSSAPDDLPNDLVNNCLTDLALAFDSPSQHDIALEMVKPQGEGYLDGGRFMYWPEEALKLDPDSLFPKEPNGAINQLIAKQIQYVRMAMKKRGLSESDIPHDQNTDHPDLIVPPWFFKPRIVAGLEKSVRTRAWETLPELQRLHTAESTLGNTNTRILMETGWNPTDNQFPAPRSVRESTELSRMTAEARKAEHVIGYCDPDRLIAGWMIPEWVRDANAWENPSLTLPDASWQFYMHDERRRLPSNDVDTIGQMVTEWLRGQRSEHRGYEHYLESGHHAANAFHEILYKMKHRDGLHQGCFGEAEPAVARVERNFEQKPSSGVAAGLVVPRPVGLGSGGQLDVIEYEA